MEMTDQVRIALVGCGNIAGVHVYGYEQLYKKGCRDFLYTACCSRNEENARKMAEKIASIQGTMPAIFTDTDSLINAKVADAADVCLPHFLHHSSACQLLEGGLHVMVEKPIGITIKANKKMIEAANNANKILATAENTRRGLNSRAWAWAIKEKKIVGEILAAHITLIERQPLDWSNPVFTWRGIKMLAGGGMILDSGAHFCDMQRVLFGEPQEIFCRMETLDKRNIANAPIVGSVGVDIEDTWHAMIRFVNGVNITWTHSRQLYDPGLKFAHYYGTEGTVQDLGFPFHSFESGGIVTLSDGSVKNNDSIISDYLEQLDDKLKEKLFPFGCNDGFSIELWDFADSIRNNRKPEIDGEEGLRAKTLAIACYESAYTNSLVKYDDILTGKISEYQNSINEYWKI